MTIREQIYLLKQKLSGNMMQDMEIRDQIHKLEMQLNKVKPNNNHITCVGCSG